MTVSPDFREYALDQIGRVVPVTSRAMFGGVGIYSDGFFFALIDDDLLYLKVDDRNRPDFEAIGSSAFQPFKDRPDTMNYFLLPGEILEDAGRMEPWILNAIEVARRARRKKKK